MAGPSKASTRPVSPHLQVWRPHVTMATSILHRGAGMALYVCAIGLVAWLLGLRAGPEAFALVDGARAHVLGQGVIYLALVGLAYHLANGVRHLFWDAGAGYSPKTADATSWLVILFALLAPLGVWALATL